MNSHRSVEIVEKRLFFYLANITTCFLSRPGSFPMCCHLSRFFPFSQWTQRKEHTHAWETWPRRYIWQKSRCCLCCAESPKGDSGSANKDTNSRNLSSAFQSLQHTPSDSRRSLFSLYRVSPLLIIPSHHPLTKMERKIFRRNVLDTMRRHVLRLRYWRQMRKTRRETSTKLFGEFPFNRTLTQGKKKWLFF